MPPQQPVIPFVTITPITLRSTILEGYEMWFHLDGIAEMNDGGIEDLHPENMAMYVEAAPGSVKEVPIEAIQRIRPNVWMVIPQRDQEPLTPLVRMVFSLDVPMGIRAHAPASGGIETYDTLREYIDKTQQQLDGHRMQSERFGEALVVYAREQTAAGRLEQ
jgi:hypothetical protein